MLSSTKILVTSVQKLFNGLTRFGLNRQSIAVGSLLMDDAHACSDIIREACRIRIPREEHAAQRDDLESQGVGTFADICNKSPKYIQQIIDTHHLAVGDFLTGYSKKLRHLK